MGCLIVAEIGINHNGSIDVAKKMISAASAAGCGFVKFQKRTIDLVYTKEELGKYRESPWGTTNREQKQGLELGLDEYKIIDKYCSDQQISWFASPWDVESVKFLERFDLPFIKIASAGITDFELLQAIKRTGKRVVLSTGMSTQDEVGRAVNFLGDQVEYILACTSTYPTLVEEMNLGFIKTLINEYPDKKIGFSNHSTGIPFILSAVALGAQMVEFHMTLDRAMYGSDQAASIEIPGMFKVVSYIRDLEVAMGTGNWTVFDSEQKIKKKLRKSI